ncbi:Protein MAIN-LIKE 2 [Linum perenne]
MRQRSTSLHWSPQYQQFLEGCRLLGVRAVLGHTPCKELVTALIERWRPETNTFHLVPGEATITLEDVEVLTGLPTTGRPLIVSLDERPVTEICEQWLGVQPPANAIAYASCTIRCCPSNVLAINSTCLYLTVRNIPPMIMTPGQCLKASIHGPNAQNTLLNILLSPAGVVLSSYREPGFVS